MGTACGANNPVKNTIVDPIVHRTKTNTMSEECRDTHENGDMLKDMILKAFDKL